MVHTKQFMRSAVVALALMSLAACKSSSDAESDANASSAMGSMSSESTSSAAQASGAGTSGRLSAEQIEAENALRQTVFYFDFDIAEFRGTDRETLMYHARDLAANPSKRLRLEGHADERGTREYNLALGARRANAVRDFLISQGVDSDRLETISFGKERPVSLCSDESCWSKNRRAVSTTR